ncbi:MAG: NAD-dependent epimerase/dehydratase family protein [Nitriliruptoraceae bacterium]
MAQRVLEGARVVVTGAAGFLGSHVTDALLARGASVVGIDNLVTGSLANLAHLQAEPRFHLQRHDVTNHIDVDGRIDLVLHAASPASPADYLQLPIQTLKVGSLGTHNALGLAKDAGAGFLLFSTSEVYGDPQVHPQPESYRGNVDPIGPRGVYDEAKRFAEALTFAYHRTHGVPVHVARIFNTYGPRMRLDDGRAVPTFIGQALAGEPLTVHGDGRQTRSLCYVDDLVDGLLRLVERGVTGPINLGSDDELSVTAIAHAVRRAVGREVDLVHLPRPVDDPQVRCPDLSSARTLLDWTATTPLEVGLARTIAAVSRG